MKKFVVIFISSLIILLSGYIIGFESIKYNFEKLLFNRHNIFDDYPVIAHALYGIDNNRYGNCLECLEEGYQKGVRIFEADFLFTSDDKLVLNRRWKKKILSSDKFLKTKIFSEYTPMDIKMLLEKMMEYKDIYIVIDSKEENYNKDIYSVYERIINEAKKIDKSLVDRFIPQYYDYEMYYEIKKLHTFKYDMVTLYKWPDYDISEIINFCKEEHIEVITIPIWEYNEKTFTGQNWKDLNENKIKVYVHTINDQEQYDSLKLGGIDGIYTDFLN